MRKVFSLFLAVIMVISVLPITSTAVFADSTSFRYRVIQGEVQIAGLKSTDTKDIVIPAEIDNKPVTSIGEYAFYNLGGITGIVIPDSVKTIEDYAFSYSAGIKNIDLGEGVETIGKNVFSGNEKLQSLKIPKSVKKIDPSAFNYMAALKSYTVDPENKYYSSKDGVLFNKSKSVLLDYPKGKTSKAYTVPATVNRIKSQSFENQTYITDLTIQSSVRYIESGAFDYIWSIENLKVLENNKYFSSKNGVLFNKSKSELILYPMNNKRTSYTVPKSVKIIGPCAFLENRYLKSVVMQNGLTEIGDEAFYCAGNLTDITIPKTVIKIGSMAFLQTGFQYKCENWGNDMIYINTCLISTPYNASKINVKKGTTTLAANSIYNNNKLETLILPEGLKSIGNSAITECEKLEKVTIPSSVEYIGNYTFDQTSLTDVYYLGTEENWNKINFGKMSDVLENATKHFISTFKLNYNNLTYNGKTRNVNVIVKDGEGKTLKKDVDYKVVIPSGRKNVGKYKYKVNFVNGYEGSRTLTLTIKPKSTYVTKLTSYKKGFKVTWKKRTTQTTGYQIKYSRNSKFTNSKTKTISGSKYTSKSISKLYGGKKYFVKVRTYKTVNGERIYSDWSSYKYVTTKN